MKHGITISIALALSIVLLSLASSDSTAMAQQQNRFRVDTGVVTLGPNQILRITINAGAGNDTIAVRFGRMEYMQSTCSGEVCKLVVASQSTTDPIMLMPGEAASFDIPRSSLSGNNTYSGVVESNRRNVQVNAMIIDTATQEVVTTISINFGKTTQE